MPAIPDYFHCIVCDRPLMPSFDEDDDLDVPLNNGCQFQFFGNYGTALFDPSPTDPEKFVEITVCDWCLANKSHRARVYMKDGSTIPFAEVIKSVQGPTSPEGYDAQVRDYLLVPPLL